MTRSLVILNTKGDTGHIMHGMKYGWTENVIMQTQHMQTGRTGNIRTKISASHGKNLMKSIMFVMEKNLIRQLQSLWIGFMESVVINLCVILMMKQ